MHQICQLDQYTTVVSELTGRTVYINDSIDQYLISPDIDLCEVAVVVAGWQARVKATQPSDWPPLHMYSAVAELAECCTREAVSSVLHTVLVTEYRDLLVFSSVVSCQSLLVTLMLNLWSCGAVAWPIKEQVPFGNIPLMLKNAGFTEGPLSYLTKIRAYLNRRGSDDPSTFRFVLDHILSRVGIVTIGDITPKTFYLSEERSRKGKLRTLGIQAVLSVVRDENYKQTIGWTPEDFGLLPANLARMVRDDNFTWLISKDPAMAEWAKLGIEYLQSNPKNFYSRKWAVKHFLDYYLKLPELPRNPSEYFDIRLRPAALFNIQGRKGLKSMPLIYEFLNQVLYKVCAMPGHVEIAVLMPGFANPLPKPSYKSQNLGETHREVMPTRLISLAMHILTDNDFAWAKEVGRIKDVFRRLNPETGEYETIWSPVRVYAILMKLLLPARTYQVRMLDSGEGDTYRYRGDGVWETNIRVLDPSASGEIVERGVFRRYIRKDRSEGAVFYFNTNKTADIDSGLTGYIMRWEKKDALQLLVELRDWQEKFNPVSGPSAWSDLTELKKVKHSDELLKIGSSFFLFRDPVNIKHPDFPVTDVRVRGLWLKLMEEMEKRLENAGKTVNDGSKIRIISTRDKKSKQPSSAIFDLHSLRVSIITAMYEEGVPPEYLMKIVGHATVFMTLYYTKLSAEALSLRIDEALIEHHRKSQSEMAGFISRASRRELEQAVAFRHPSALDAAASGTGIGLLVMDHGICPVSASRCHEGLAVCDPATGVTRFQAVPGGATNCSRCRFFMTGPAFLIGLEAHVNDLAYRLKKASFAFEKTQEKFDTLADAYAAALDDGEPFHRQRELEIAECASESATAEVDNIALSLQAAYTLTEQCISINAQDRGNGLSLVVVGGTGQLEAVLSEGHEFEQLNRICVNATLFDGLNINWKQPNLERARLFDRMLRNSGHESRFFLLNDEDTLHVANAMAQFLYARLDANTVHALVDGRITLRAVGLDVAFMSQLDNLIPKNLATNILGLA